MAAIKCRCGVYTQNGLFCTNCSKDSSIETLYYAPDDTEDDELVEDIEGLTILDDPDECDEDD
jgi:hypothetical protein